MSGSSSQDTGCWMATAKGTESPTLTGRRRSTPMRKTILGLAAIAAIATPLTFASSAQAATTTSTAIDCTPVTEVLAAPAQTHVEYKYKRADGTPGHIQWSTENAATLPFGGVAYVR